MAKLELGPTYASPISNGFDVRILHRRLAIHSLVVERRLGLQLGVDVVVPGGLLLLKEKIPQTDKKTKQRAQRNATI